jgi:citrate lyase subunit beta/citryl-CoA lyase
MRSLLLTDLSDAGLESGADALILDNGFDARSFSARTKFIESARRRAQRPLLIARIGRLDGAEVEAELDALMRAAPDAVMLETPRGGIDVQRLGAKLAVREALYGLDDGSTRIVALSGASALSLFSLATYAGCSARLGALVFDADALAEDLGILPPARRRASPLALARDLVLIAARAARVPAIDAKCFGDDETAFRAEAEAAREIGYAGKIAKNAAEATAINKIFGRDEIPLSPRAGRGLG